MSASLFPKPVQRSALSDQRSSASASAHTAIRAEIARLYERANRLNVPWNGHHGKRLAALLKANPSWPLEAWLRCVHNRFASDGINPAEDPIRWIGKLVNYARGPLDKFGGLKPRSHEQIVEDYWAGRMKR